MRWRGFFERNRRDRELEYEIAFYIEREIEDNVARGMSVDDARRAARRKFGNPTIVREAVYDMNTIHVLDILVQDLRYAWRQLRLRPGFALAAITSLALGIGANTAIFTLVDQLLVRLLPVERPHELVLLRADGIRPGGNWGDGRRTFPYPTYLALRDRTTSVFAGLTGQRVESVALQEDGQSAMVPVAMVAGNYFQVLGVRPHLGRLLTPDDDRMLNGHPVAVLQYDLWRSQYQGRQDIVGATIRLNGSTFTIIGVAAAGFEGTNVGVPTKVFVPVTMQPTIAPTNPPLFEERTAWFYLLARIKPGVSLAEAEAAAKVVYRQRQEEELNQPYFGKFPESREGFLQHRFVLEPADRGSSSLRAQFERPLIVLAWLAAAVLLIACANIAGLLLGRGAARRRDLALRRAIGASRGRIVVQLFAESALLAMAGAVAAVFLGSWLTRLLIALLPNSADLSLSPSPDLRILAFTGAVAAFTVMLFGLFPAWQNSRVAPVATLREEATAVAGGRTQARLRKVFVGLQVALSVVLLLGAGLFVRSLLNLQRVDLGVKSENVVTFLVYPAMSYDLPRKLQAYRSLVEELARVPGVIAVGAGRTALFTGGRSDGVFTIEGMAAASNEAPFSFVNAVTPGYFEALGIPLAAGADFTWRDWGGGKRLVIVNEVLTRRYFGGTPPIGRRIGTGSRAPTADIEIVGVAGDSRYHDVRGEVPAQRFFNLDSVMAGVARVAVYVKTAGDPRQVMPSLRAEVRRVDPNFIISGMRTLDDQIATRMLNERMLSFLSIGFAALACALAVIGLHGVLAFQVTRRTREIGIRMALGARRGMIVRLVSREMYAVVLGGLASGVAAAYSGGRFVQNQLFGVDAHDPLMLGVAVSVLLLAAAAATLLPALRAARIDPMLALRHE
jgi:predicted permease